VSYLVVFVISIFVAHVRLMRAVCKNKTNNKKMQTKMTEEKHRYDCYFLLCVFFVLFVLDLISSLDHNI
jgi:hypothetical protein